MGQKQMVFRSEAREKILHGATALADAVSVMLGPIHYWLVVVRTQNCDHVVRST